MTIVWFREIGWTRTSLRFAIEKEEYSGKRITFIIEFEKCDVEEICKQIDGILEAFDEKEGTKYQTSPEVFETINIRTLNSVKTVYDLFLEQGVDIQVPKGS